MKRQHGVFSVEFAIAGLLFFVLLFGVLEVGRLFYTVNTLHESVRRGARLAAVCDIQDSLVLRRAAFADSSGQSLLLADLSSAQLQLRYLDSNGNLLAAPLADFNRIRFVEVSLPTFTYRFLGPWPVEQINLPPFRATLLRESLGRHAESGVIPEITPC